MPNSQHSNKEPLRTREDSERMSPEELCGAFEECVVCRARLLDVLVACFFVLPLRSELQIAAGTNCVLGLQGISG